MPGSSGTLHSGPLPPHLINHTLERLIPKNLSSESETLSSTIVVSHQTGFSFQLAGI